LIYVKAVRTGYLTLRVLRLLRARL